MVSDTTCDYASLHKYLNSQGEHDELQGRAWVPISTRSTTWISTEIGLLVMWPCMVACKQQKAQQSDPPGPPASRASGVVTHPWTALLKQKSNFFLSQELYKHRSLLMSIEDISLVSVPLLKCPFPHCFSKLPFIYPKKSRCTL